jgi:DNA uptake protein ComE-like DNA-binding protein
MYLLYTVTTLKSTTRLLLQLAHNYRLVSNTNFSLNNYLANLSTPNINTISRDNLMALEGIGPQYVATILQERETRPFSSNKDFQNRVKLYTFKWTF